MMDKSSCNKRDMVRAPSVTWLLSTSTSLLLQGLLLQLVHTTTCTGTPLPLPAALPAPQGVVVLSYHNCGSSLLVKLLMMMGLYAGESKDLHMGVVNRLKYFERFNVMKANEKLLAAHSSAHFPHWMAIGFNLSAAQPDELGNHSSAVRSELQQLEQHHPWVIKDPRLLWTAQLWLQQMQTPVCVFMYRHPLILALRLSGHRYKGHVANGTVRAHLHAWAHGMHAALSACADKPTVVLPYSMMRPDHLMKFVLVLASELQRAGLAVQPITQDHLQTEVLDHFRFNPAQPQVVQESAIPSDLPLPQGPEAVEEEISHFWDQTSEAYSRLAAALQQHIQGCTMSVEPACDFRHTATAILQAASLL